jgi:hypothetical protein
VKPLPETFIWSRLGTEAGETLPSIVRRKQLEELAYGFFAWGIGSAIVKAWQQLSMLESQPRVFFSPIKGRPRAVDTVPSSLLLWQEWERDGITEPTQGVITSHGGARSHYAMLCRDIQVCTQGEQLAADVLVNLLSGKRVGNSQVTAVVRQTGGSGSAFRRIFATATVLDVVRLRSPVEVRRANIEHIVLATDAIEFRRRVEALTLGS